MMNLFDRVRGHYGKMDDFIDDINWLNINHLLVIKR